VNRRDLLAGLAGASALAATRDGFERAAAQTAGTPLRVGSTTNEVALGPFYAQSIGSFAKAGLNVQIQTMTNGAASAAAVVGGALDIGEGNVLSIVLAHVRNVDLVFVAPAGQYSAVIPNSGLLVLKESPIHTARDLTGKTVAVFSLGDLTQLATAAWIDQNGGDSTSVKFIEIPPSQTVAALQRGTIDMGLATEPVYTDSMSITRSLGPPYSAVAKRFLSNGYYARRDWAAQNTDTVKRFAKGLTDGQRWAMQNRTAADQILTQMSKIPPEIVARMVHSTFPDRLEPQMIQPVIDLAQKYGRIKEGFPATDICIG